MKLATREKWMLALLPTAIGLLAYVFLQGKDDRVDTLEGQLDRALTGLPAPGEAASARSEAERARDEEQDAIERRDAVKSELLGFKANRASAAGNDVAARVARFTAVFEGHGLALVASEPTRSTVRRTESTTNADRRWKLHFSGTWRDFERAVSAAAEDPSLRFIPVSVEMESMQNASAARVWTLVIAV